MLICLYTADIPDHILCKFWFLWFFFLPRYISEVAKLYIRCPGWQHYLVLPVTSGVLEVVDMVSYGSSWQNPVIFPRSVRYLKTRTLPRVIQKTMRKNYEAEPRAVSNHSLRPRGLQIT